MFNCDEIKSGLENDEFFLEFIPLVDMVQVWFFSKSLSAEAFLEYFNKTR
jgi:sensor c-di-GMP phosphodiesterase-like protein